MFGAGPLAALDDAVVAAVVPFSRRFLSSRFAPLALVLGSAAVVATLDSVRGVIPYNADQAIVGLMAQDILYDGTHRAFYDGSEYSGTIEQYYLAGWFALLPDTVGVHRASMASLMLAMLAVLWLLFRRLAGAGAATAGALFLGLGPHYFFLRTITSDGSYTPIYLLSAGILCLIARAEWQASAGRTDRWSILAIGALSGLSWWTHPMASALLVVAVAAFATGQLRRAAGWRLRLWSLALFFGGSLPWWIRNLRSGWASVGGAHNGLAPFGRLGERWRGLALDGVPILAGGEVVHGTFAHVGWALAAIGTHGLLILAGFVLLWRSGDARLRKLLLLVMLLTGLAAGMGLITSHTGFASPRFLFPAYFLVALCFGVTLTSARVPPAARAALIALVAALHLHSHRAAGPSAAPSPRLARDLQALGVTQLYTTYWRAYPITFRTHRQITAAPFGRDQPRRGRAEEALVDRAAAPAFLLPAAAAAQFGSFLTAGNWAYQRSTLGELTLFQQVPEPAIALVRACACLHPDSP